MSKRKKLYYFILGCFYILITFPFKIFKRTNTNELILSELKDINTNLNSINTLVLTEKMYKNYMFQLWADNGEIIQNFLMDRHHQQIRENWRFN